MQLWTDPRTGLQSKTHYDERQKQITNAQTKQSPKLILCHMTLKAFNTSSSTTPEIHLNRSNSTKSKSSPTSAHQRIRRARCPEVGLGITIQCKKQPRPRHHDNSPRFHTMPDRRTPTLGSECDTKKPTNSAISEPPPRKSSDERHLLIEHIVGRRNQESHSTTERGAERPSLRLETRRIHCRLRSNRR